MPRPSRFPTWATDAGAPVLEPSVAKAGEGWQPTEIPPAEFFNWLQRTVGEWLVYLDEEQVERPRLYATASEAIDATTAGDIVVLREPLTGSGGGLAGSDVGGPWEQAWANALGGGTAIALETDGRWVYVAHSSGGGVTLRSLNREDGVERWSLFFSTPEHIAVDALGLYVSSGSNLSQLSRDDGSAVPTWVGGGTFDHGAQINDLEVNGVDVYLCGVGAVSPTSGTNGQIRALTQVGSEFWFASHGADLEALTVTRRHVYAGGADPGGGLTLRRYDRSTGLNAQAYTPGGAVKALANDGEWVYASVDAVGLVAFSAEQGLTALRWTVGTAPDRVFVDDRFVYGWSDGASSVLRVRDKVTGVVVYQETLSGVLSGNAVSDGTQTYIANGSSGLLTRRLPAALRLWVRAAGNAHATPFKQLLLPL